MAIPVAEVDVTEQEPVEAEPVASGPPARSEPVVGERTFAALRALEKGDGETVRITWLGDSHTAADFWTGEVRRRLQARFGNAGPGFVSLALGGRRHEVASFKVKGTWKQEPKSGASRSRQLDGQFGLSGRRLHGFPGASLEIKGGVASASRWSLLYRQHPSQSPAPYLELRGSDELVVKSNEQHEAEFEVSTFEQAAGAGPLAVHVKRGQYLLWGVVVEATQPGLVLDALGINGARLRTLLAWDTAAWRNQLAWRRPHLVVLSYGTNETGDGGDMGRYADAYAEVVQHIHSTGADCMLAGPTDRQGDGGHTMPEVEALDEHQRKWAEELGCLYYSPFLAMGGRGGYGKWRRHKPQFAATDGVHLTISGYRFLAEDWVEQFLESYENYVTSHP
jgi:lysophospholipase L1-like esterase